MRQLRFIKAHAYGNDFLFIDESAVAPTRRPTLPVPYATGMQASVPTGSSSIA